LYSARSLADRLEEQRLLRDLFGRVAMPDRVYDRAGEIQQRLTETGQHRSAAPVDLLIAATAERERLMVLCDMDPQRRPAGHRAHEPGGVAQPGR
jgi:predicted nucleic acid-binding protein